MNPLFLASQFAAILEITNIHTSIRNFDHPEDRWEFPLFIENVPYVLLTETGVMKLVIRSIKPNAKTLTTWIFQRIKVMKQAFIAHATAMMQVQLDSAIVQRNNATLLLECVTMERDSLLATLAVPIVVAPNEFTLYLEYKTRQLMRGGDPQLLITSQAINRDMNFVCRYRMSLPEFDGWSENQMSLMIDVNPIEGVQKMENDDGKTWYTLNVNALKKYLRSIDLLKREWWEIRV